MVLYSQPLYELARFDCRDQVSQRTGQEFTYTYYIELVQQHRRGGLTLDQYYDFEISRLKYDINRPKIF
jgi:hypothetical protein